MRLGSARALLGHLLYGGPPSDRSPEPRRWLRGRAGRDALRTGCARLTVAYALRAGGALPQTVFDADGERLVAEPLWGPGVARLADWRLSAAAGALVLELWQRLEAPSNEPIVARPTTVADVLLWQALAQRLAAEAVGPERDLALLLADASPLTAVLSPDRAAPTAPDWERLAPLLEAHWLLPYLADHVVRRWLAADARRGMISRADEAALNQRLLTLLDGLWQRWQAAGRSEHLRLFVSFYARLMRSADGLAGVLRTARRGGWTDWSTQERERFEASLGVLYGFAQRLTVAAEDLRGLGWNRTAADEAYLGAYGRDLAPWADSLQRLHHELCRIV